jgi:hypothetical protein
MMSVIHICRCGCLKVTELLFFKYTSSSCHWRLIEIISHQLDGIAWTCVLYAQLQYYHQMVDDFLGTS